MGHNKQTMKMLYWNTDKSWYVYDPSEEFLYRLTDKAPKEARKSFELWLKHQRES